MSSSDHLLKATLNRLSAKIEEKLTYLTTKLTTLSKEAPEKLKKEWELFKEEVKEEADWLDQQSDENSSYKESNNDDPQETIDRIRLKIADFDKLSDN